MLQPRSVFVSDTDRNSNRLLNPFSEPMPTSGPLASVMAHRQMILALSWSAISSRYRGSWLGLVWPLLQPLVLLGVFTLVFSAIMPLRWVGAGGSDVAFPLFLYSGLVIFSFFSEVASRAPTIVTERPNLVRKVVFPLHVLGVVNVVVAGMFFCVNFLVLTAFLWWSGHPAAMAVLYLLLFFPALFVGMIGVTWYLGALTVYVRDTAQIVAMAIPALMFFTPVFYPLSSVSSSVRGWLVLNPLTHAVEGLRSMVFEASLPALSTLGVFWGISLLVFITGWYWFKRLQLGFSDVL